MRGVSTPKDICLRRSDTTQVSHSAHNACSHAAHISVAKGAGQQKGSGADAFSVRRTYRCKTRGARIRMGAPNAEDAPSGLVRCIAHGQADGRLALQMGLQGAIEPRKKNRKEVFRREILGKSTRIAFSKEFVMHGTRLKKDQATVFSKWRVYRQIPKKYTCNEKASTVGSRPLATCNKSEGWPDTNVGFTREQTSFAQLHPS